MTRILTVLYVISLILVNSSFSQDKDQKSTAYSLSPQREQYGNLKGNFHQLTANEEISNFTTGVNRQENKENKVKFIT